MKRLYVCALLLLASCGATLAQDWDAVAFTAHSVYQAVNADGSSAYSGAFPIRMRGVLLNNPEDWLDPTFEPDPGFGNYNMGGEWEVFVQAANLDGTAFDPDPSQPFTDFGGTACWMGQNYAGLPWVPEWMTYSEPEWEAELERLDFAGGVPGVDPRLRAGDLIEIRARGGLAYQGKMNVNEQHSTNPESDFEIVLLEQGFGRPAPSFVTTAAFKDAGDLFIFDPTRQSGGERYQSTWVELLNVEVVDPENWATDSEVTVTDGLGRTLLLRLGRDENFTVIGPPPGRFRVRGVLNQMGGGDTDGYRLVVLQATDARPAADVNGDGLVNQPDLGLLLATYGRCEGDADYDPNADIDGDDCVGQQDLGILLAAYH
jgi:hypothetical protein